MVLPHSSSNAQNIGQGGGWGFRYPSSNSSEEVMGGATSFPFLLPKWWAGQLAGVGASNGVLSAGLFFVATGPFLAWASCFFVASRDLLTSGGVNDSSSLEMTRGLALLEAWSCTMGGAGQLLSSSQCILIFAQCMQALLLLPAPGTPSPP